MTFEAQNRARNGVIISHKRRSLVLATDHLERHPGGFSFFLERRFAKNGFSVVLDSELADVDDLVEFDADVRIKIGEVGGLDVGVCGWEVGFSGGSSLII